MGFFVAEVDGAEARFGRVRLLTPPPDVLPDGVPLGWYLMCVMVEPRWRRRGLGDCPTLARLGWVQQRANEVWYLANARNWASIDLHEKYGFVEVTRDFTVAGLDVRRWTWLRDPVPLCPPGAKLDAYGGAMSDHVVMAVRSCP